MWGEGCGPLYGLSAAPFAFALAAPRAYQQDNYQQESLAPKMPTLPTSCARPRATTLTLNWRGRLTVGAKAAHAFYRDTHVGQGRNSTRPVMPQEEWVWGAL